MEQVYLSENFQLMMYGVICALAFVFPVLILIVYNDKVFKSILAVWGILVTFLVCCAVYESKVNPGDDGGIGFVFSMLVFAIYVFLFGLLFPIRKYIHSKIGQRYQKYESPKAS